MDSNTFEILIGGLAIPLVQLIKVKFGLAGLKAQWLAFSISVLFAVGLTAARGDLALAIESPDMFVETLSAIFASGYLGYRLLLKSA